MLDDSNWPPSRNMMSGFISALAAYTPALNPAGPAPMMISLTGFYFYYYLFIYLFILLLLCLKGEWHIYGSGRKHLWSASRIRLLLDAHSLSELALCLLTLIRGSNSCLLFVAGIMTWVVDIGKVRYWSSTEQDRITQKSDLIEERHKGAIFGIQFVAHISFPQTEKQ
jgi:hypothetical protein